MLKKNEPNFPSTLAAFTLQDVVARPRRLITPYR